MGTQRLFFTSADGKSLFVTDGTTVTPVADGAATPRFLSDPLYAAISTVNVGSTVYFTMADTTDGTSAIWRYDGNALTQITPSSNYVFNTRDSGDPGAPAR